MSWDEHYPSVASHCSHLLLAPSPEEGIEPSSSVVPGAYTSYTSYTSVSSYIRAFSPHKSNFSALSRHAVCCRLLLFQPKGLLHSCRTCQIKTKEEAKRVSCPDYPGPRHITYTLRSHLTRLTILALCNLNKSNKSNKLANSVNWVENIANWRRVLYLSTLTQTYPPRLVESLFTDSRFDQ